MLQANLNIDRIHEQMYKHKSRAEPYMDRARASSIYLNKGKELAGEGLDPSAIADDAVNAAQDAAADAANQAAE